MNVVDTRDSSDGAAKTVERDGGRNTLEEDEGGGLGCEGKGSQLFARATSTREDDLLRGRADEKMMQVMTSETAGSLYMRHE